MPAWRHVHSIDEVIQERKEYKTKQENDGSTDMDIAIAMAL